MQKKKSKVLWIISVVSVVFVLFVWWLVTDGLGIFSSNTLPSPIKIVQAFIRKLTDPNPDGATLGIHLMSSLKIVLTGYLLGVVIGIPLGIVMAWYEKADLMIRPVFDMIRTVPGIAWVPVMVVFCGIGFTSKAIVIFIGAVVANVINAYSGIKQTKQVHLWVGATFGASNWQLLTKIALPSAFPMIMNGLKLSLGGAWTTIVAAELLASNKGIGYMIQQARGILRPDIIIVGMFVIGIVGSLLMLPISLIEKKVMKGGKW
ncbi:MAG: ABC transporter permease [Ruminococcus sp.]